MKSQSNYACGKSGRLLRLQILQKGELQDRGVCYGKGGQKASWNLYIYEEREREISMYTYMYVYIYIGLRDTMPASFFETCKRVATPGSHTEHAVAIPVQLEGLGFEPQC